MDDPDLEKAVDQVPTRSSRPISDWRWQTDETSALVAILQGQRLKLAEPDAALRGDGDLLDARTAAEDER